MHAIEKSILAEDWETLSETLKLASKIDSSKLEFVKARLRPFKAKIGKHVKLDGDIGKLFEGL